MIGTDRRAVRSSRVGGAPGGRALPTTILPWLSSKDAPAFFLEKQQLAGHDQLMKTSLRILLAAAALAALGACATYPKAGQPALVGTWTNPLGTVWVLNADGTFTVDLNHDGKTDVTGKYSVSGDMITIEELHGKTPKGCKGPATYKFARTDKDSLQFTVVSDTCKLRIQNVTQGWKRK